MPNGFEATPVDIRELLDRQRRAWETCADPDAVAADFAEDAVFAAPHENHVGRAAIRAAAAGFFAYAESVQIDVTRIMTSGSHGVVEWDWAEYPRDGSQPRHAKDAIIFEVRNGQFTQWREYINWLPADGTK